MKKYIVLTVICLITIVSLFLRSEVALASEVTFLQVPLQTAKEIGEKIYYNETGGKRENLIFWNKNESFLSLGIGHFIWYPEHQDGPFNEEFPNLLTYLQTQGVQLPQWLVVNSNCPWNTYEEFQGSRKGQRVAELHKLLASTIPQQTQFIIQRLENALPKILTSISQPELQQHIKSQFYRVAETPAGLYALVDYVNFKGEGVSLKERYHGQGWGLLQVLANLKSESDSAVHDFAKSAVFILERRVRNAPLKRKQIEQKWLIGWKKRIQTYRTFHSTPSNSLSQHLKATKEKTKISKDTIPPRDNQKELNTYFNVKGVIQGDALNIREYAYYKSPKIGEIPFDGKCIKSLGLDLKTKNRSVWKKIQYHSYTGWVNSGYLTLGSKCNSNEL